MLPARSLSAGRCGLPPRQGRPLAVRRNADRAGRRFLPASAGRAPRRASRALPLGDGDDPFGAEFAHASSAWRDLAPTVCYLSEQHRQSDRPFLDVLAAIRANACVGIHRERLAARQIGRDALPENCTRLFTHNAAVDEINQQRLAKLGGETHVFSMAAKGAEPFVQALKRGCLSPEMLQLKQGRGGDVHQERSRAAATSTARSAWSRISIQTRAIRSSRRAAASASSPSPQPGRSRKPARSAPASRKCRSGSPGR